MRKILSFMFVIVLSLCMAVTAAAATEKNAGSISKSSLTDEEIAKGFEYALLSGSDISEIAVYGFDADILGTDVVIPETICGIKVTHIYSGGVFGWKKLTSLTIPNSVTNIDHHAFSGCTGLTSVTIGNSVTSIGEYAFGNCTGLTSIIIPDSVTNIGGSAFSGCTGLTSVTIGSSVASISWSAFENCTELTKINWDAENVEDFDFESSIFFNAGTSGDGIDVVFGDNVKVIPAYAFDGANVKSVTIGNSVTSIGSFAFKGCTGLTKINWNAENVKDFSEYNDVFSNAGTSGDGIDVVFGDNVKHIPAWLFFSDEYYYRSPSIKSVTIGNSVISIGYSAFKGCTEITSVTIPDSVTSIGSNAFDDTAWYDSQPYGDVYVGKVYYKYKGTMLANTEITIKDGTKGIAASAFDGCSGLASVTIPNSVTNIGKYAFNSVKVHISDLTAWCNADKDSNKYNLYLNGKRIINLVIPNNVTSISDYTFSGCTGLKSVTIPDSVTSIGDSAFYYCYGLTSVIIGNSVTSIGKGAFEDCYRLTSITIPDSVTSIGGKAFSGCPLTEIKIGKGLKSIGEDAFNGIKVIPEIYYAGSEAEWKSILIDSSNDLILRATMHYNADLSHTHNYIETVTKKATCTEDGVKTFTCNCGGTYTEIIPATGHKYVTETYKATCTAIGVSIKKCKSCGTVASVTTTPAKGHTEVTDKAVAATCTQSGKTAGSHCSVCGAVLVAQNDVPATGHSTKTSALLTATETESGILITSCETCGRITGASLINRIESVSLSKTSYTYNGKAQKPKVVVKNSKGKLLTEGKDYTVKYQSGRKNPGTYTVTVTFKGNYSGKKTLTFTIAPKAPTLKASAAKKSAKLSWNKQTGATGYNIYMATSKNGKYKKIATVKNGKVSYTKAGLTKGKTYYFKVAAYTASGGKTINGAYSAVKSVKVK